MQIIDLFVHIIWIIFYNIHTNYRFICAWQFEICIGVIFIIIKFYSYQHLKIILQKITSIWSVFALYIWHPILKVINLYAYHTCKLSNKFFFEKKDPHFNINFKLRTHGAKKKKQTLLLLILLHLFRKSL